MRAPAVIATACVVALLSAASAAAQNPPQEFWTARTQRDEARARRDRAAFERLTAANFVVVDQMGRVENRSERAERLARPGPGPIVTTQRSNERTAMYNNDTVVLFWQENGPAGPQNVTEIWVKDDGQWKVAAAHVSQPPPAAGRQGR
jgi:hypothetical protein